MLRPARRMPSEGDTFHGRIQPESYDSEYASRELVENGFSVINRTEVSIGEGMVAIKV